MPAPKSIGGMESNEQFDKALRGSPGVSEAVDFLAGKGCDRVFLLDTLASINLAYSVYKRRTGAGACTAFAVPGDGFEALTGFTRKKLKTVIGRMRDCADDIRRLRAGFLANIAPRARQAASQYLQMQSRLPFDLHSLAAVAEEAARHLRLRGRPEYDDAIAALVKHVERKRGRNKYDEKLATLIAFATDNPEFNADALRTWRMEHSDLLSSRR